MRDLKVLFESVVRNVKYGFYELAKEYRKSTDDFYKDEYYQDDHALYQHVEYDELDIDNKNYFYAQKLYVMEKWGGYATQDSSFLDIGTGEGYALKYFYENGWQVTGIDFSSHGIEAHNPEMKKYLIQGDYCKIIGALRNEKRTFDFINADNVLEHLPEPETFFEIIRSVSHTNTVICVTVPNDFSRIQHLAFELGQIEDAFWVTKDTSEHFSYYSVESLCSLGDSKGFKKIIATSDWPIDFFLLHKNTNYRRNSTVGHDCHVACASIENSVYADSMEKAIALFRSLAEAGIGREISVYFKLK